MRSSLVLAALTATVLVVPIASDATAQDDKVLSFAMSSDVSSFDPAIAYDFFSNAIVHTLVTYDEGTNIVPGIAAAMPTISADGRTYTFDLRPDVSFVRKGEILRPVTADDVVFSINRLLRPDLAPTPSPVGPSFFSIIEGADAVLAGTADAASGIRAVDADTVEFTLTHADRTFLNLLAMSFGSIVPREVAGLDSAAFTADLVGSGPFYLDTYTPGQTATLRRNPHYWGAGPLVDALELRLDVSPQNQFLSAQSGQLDLMGDPMAVADRITAQNDPSIGDRLISSTVTATSWINMDTSGPDSPFADPLVRQAVNHAIDKDNLLRIAAGRGAIIDCIFPPTLPGFDADCHPYPHSVETANGRQYRLHDDPVWRRQRAVTAVSRVHQV
jgi:oligopeptide transport system substrate-binding protein